MRVYIAHNGKSVERDSFLKNKTRLLGIRV